MIFGKIAKERSPTVSVKSFSRGGAVCEICKRAARCAIMLYVPLICNLTTQILLFFYTYFPVVRYYLRLIAILV